VEELTTYYIMTTFLHPGTTPTRTWYSSNKGSNAEACYRADTCCPCFGQARADCILASFDFLLCSMLQCTWGFQCKRLRQRQQCRRLEQEAGPASSAGITVVSFSATSAHSCQRICDTHRYTSSFAHHQPSFGNRPHRQHRRRCRRRKLPCLGGRQKP